MQLDPTSNKGRSSIRESLGIILANQECGGRGGDDVGGAGR